ncbi:MAG: NFACT family protein, partial [Burkholderiales bacterium]|nr:NFACT family protein [Anaerolineae bacterium]
IIHIDIDGPEGQVTVIAEPMERRSNVLLVQAGKILDCMRRVGPEDNRYRLSLPGHEYVPPPPQTGKLDPTTLTIDDLEGILEQNDDPKFKLHRLLASNLLGVSPLLAKEVVYRATGDAEIKPAGVDADALLEALQAVINPLQARQWQPGIVETDDGVSAFSVYPLTHMAGWHEVDSVSAALAAYYGAPVGDEAYEAAKVPVRTAIREAQGKVGGKLASLQRSMTDESEREILKQSGELILAYQYTFAPGQTELQAQYDLDAPPLAVALDPTITPLENAQRYFERYNRAKRALEDVPRLIAQTKRELDYLGQLGTDLEFAANWLEIDDVQQALQSQGHWRGKRAGRIGGGRSGPLKLTTKEGFVLWVGRNSRQNDLVTFDKGGGDDWWLHARDVPGAHVVVKYDGRPVPERVIEQAASIAAYYSAKRSEARAIVDVTRCKYVRKIKGAALGMVTYRNEETRTVTPRSEAEFADQV